MHLANLLIREDRLFTTWDDLKYAYYNKVIVFPFFQLALDYRL
jgi:hypothetical protein